MERRRKTHAHHKKSAHAPRMHVEDANDDDDDDFLSPPAAKNRCLSIPLACTSTSNATVNRLIDEVQTQRAYTRRLETMLLSHQIPLPSETSATFDLIHMIHYREGSWPTKIEFDGAHQSHQHLIVSKGFCNLEASLMNHRGEKIHPRAIDALPASGPNFKFVLLCKPGNCNTFDTIRVPATGAALLLSEQVVFACNQNEINVNLDDGSFRMNEPNWFLRFRLLVSSGCARLAPRLFKVRIEPILTKEYIENHSREQVSKMQNQLTVETEPFRSLLRYHESKSIRAYHNQKQQMSSLMSSAQDGSADVTTDSLTDTTDVTSVTAV